MLSLLVLLTLPASAADLDGDGFSAGYGDCNDNDPTVNPAAIEICGDSIDQDCDGVIATCDSGDTGAGDTGAIDQDGDGYDASEDCNDTDASIYPGAPELCDPIDSDCDGSIYDADCGEEDADGDGFTANQGDCDDQNAAIHPGAVELCDGIDNNCSGIVDESFANTWYYDGDGDGFGVDSTAVEACTPPTDYVSVGQDCDDTDANTNPSGYDVCDDSIDQDCDGIDAVCETGDSGPVDEDGDGYLAADDCNDNDPTVNPGAVEICEDGLDQDCDGIDLACLPTDTGTAPTGDDDDDDDDDTKSGGCNSSGSSACAGTGGTYAWMVGFFPLGMLRRRK